MKTIRTWVLVLGLGLVGCKSASEQAVDGGESAKAAPDFVELIVKPAEKHYVYTYPVADGSFRSVESVEEIPKEAQAQVLVIDTRLSPEQRQSEKVLYVVDFTDPKEDGSFATRAVSRFKFESELRDRPNAGPKALPEDCATLSQSPKDRIVLYSASWCGVCDAARAFLKEQKLPFEEKDVEKTPGVEREIQCKAMKAGLRPDGVPLIDVGGTLLQGLNKQDVLRLAKNLEAKPGPTTL